MFTCKKIWGLGRSPRKNNRIFTKNKMKSNFNTARPVTDLLFRDPSPALTGPRAARLVNLKLKPKGLIQASSQHISKTFYARLHVKKSTHKYISKLFLINSQD